MLGVAGAYYALRLEDGLSFQPLRRIDEAAQRAAAAEWLGGIFEREGVAMIPERKGLLWAALHSLASAETRSRTLSGLVALLQDAAMKRALEPYTHAGPYGRLLDGDDEDLIVVDLVAFDFEQLLHARGSGRGADLSVPVVGRRVRRCADLVELGEAWAFLDDATFAPRIREWLKGLRKKNVSVHFATQSLAGRGAQHDCARHHRELHDADLSAQRACARTADRHDLCQLRAEPAADPADRASPAQARYYFQSSAGNRLFELGLGEIALAFAAAGSADDHRAIDRILAAHGRAGFGAAWLHHRGSDWAAELAEQDVQQREVA